MSFITKPKTQQKEKVLANLRHIENSQSNQLGSAQSHFNIHLSVNVTQLNKRMHLKTDGLSTEGDKLYDKTNASS